MARRLGPHVGGATAVEFALLLPVLLAVLTGMLEFGRAMWMRQALQFAVEEAARHALVEEDASAAAIGAFASARMDAVGPGMAGGSVTATLAADSVTVTASVDFAPILPGLLPPGTVTLGARCRLPR